jgi:ABC-type dipeptide/oligopeptide/nickel transport system permease subunit
MTIGHRPELDAENAVDDGMWDVDERSIEQSEVAGLSQGQIVRRRFFRHRGAMVALTLLVLIIVLATTSVGWGPIPGWWKWSYTDLVPSSSGTGEPTMSLRPTWLGGAGIRLGDHPFGLDNEAGKDMFAMTMRGVQTSLAVIFVLGVLATSIGVVVGALSGYYGRWVDNSLMRFTDIIIVIPLLVITAVAGFALGLRGMWPVAVGPSSWRCASASSSTPRASPTHRTGGSSSSTSCRTRSARSS